MILTIAIPTYNRPDKVTNTISRLLPQLNSTVKIMVLDNCSKVNVKEYVTAQLGDDVLNKVHIIRHRVNIGGDANFQRCFELSETPYTWMLGDDDMVAENAVELILEEINNFQDHDLIGINFNSSCCLVERKSPVIISSTTELAHKLDFFGNWLFISSSVYKTQEYLKHIHLQAWGAYSLASQLVAPITAISKNKVLVLSDKFIVTNIPEPTEVKWSNFQISLSVTSLLEANVGFKGDEYKVFGKKLKFQFVRFGDMVYSMVKSLNFNIDLVDNYHIYLLKQEYHRTIEFRDDPFKQTLLFYIWLFLTKNKFILKALFKYVPRIRRRASEAVPFTLFRR
jgi:glycosyltransferase involved in cell wall biosynthesis